MHIGAGVQSLSRIHVSRSPLPDAFFFLEFVRSPSGPAGPCVLYHVVSHSWKEGIFKQDLASAHRRTPLEWLSSNWNPLHTIRSKGALGSQGLQCPMHRRCLGGKKRKVAFQSKPTLGLVFHLWVEYMLPGGHFQTPVLWSLWDCPSSLSAAVSYLWKEGIFQAKCASAHKRTLLEWF